MSSRDTAIEARGPRTAPPGAGVATEELGSLSSARARGLLAGFTAAHFTHHVSNSLINPLLPLMRDSFALSYAQSGFLVSAFSLSLGLSNPPAGVLADRVGSRVVAVGGLVLTGIVSAALALSGAYWQLLLLMIVMGIVAATYHAPAATVIAQIFPQRVRGAAMGIHITGGHLSFFATPLVAAFLVNAGGTWREPFLWFAIAPVVGGAVLWRLTRGVRHTPSVGVQRLAVFRELWSVVQTVGPLVSASLLFQMFYAALLAFTSLYLVDSRGFSAAVAAALFGVPQLIGLLGAPLSGYMSDRIGRRAVMVIGMATLGPALYSLTVTPNELIVLPLLAIGFASSMRQTVTEVLVMDSAPAHRRATVLGGYYMLSQELGGLFAPMLGVAAGLVGLSAMYSGTALAVVGLSALIVVIYRRL
jgi:MFS transporter, FSR family, fosmidomycin resistance protein